MAIHRRTGRGRLLLGTGPEREALDSLVAVLALKDAVDFPGFHENPLPWLRRSDAFVFSSYTKGFGNVLVEAMGCSTPVISTDCEHGPAEILGHGCYGILVPPRDPEALAKAMDGVGDIGTRWPEEVLKKRAAEFTTAACAASYIRLFETLV